MKKPTHSRTRKGFSLVELLVVIAIIAILAAAAYGPITGAIRNAKIEEGNKIAGDIVFAIGQFEDKYGYLPYVEANKGTVTYTTSDAEFLKVLMGLNDEINPNRTVFFEADIASNGVNGIVYDGETPTKLVDPFNNPYTIVIDYTGEKRIDLAQTPFSGHVDKNDKPLVIRGKSAVAGSEGPDNTFFNNSDEELKDDDVRTW